MPSVTPAAMHVPKTLAPFGPGSEPAKPTATPVIEMHLFLGLQLLDWFLYSVGGCGLSLLR